MAAEYEFKFQATEELLGKIRQDLQGKEQVIQMKTTYFDTPDGKISSLRYTFRMRAENGVTVYTLKTPMPGNVRGEWEVVADRMEDAVDSLCQKGAPTQLKELVSGGIIPVCGAEFIRIAKTVILPDCVVEVAMDKGVLTGGNREIPMCEVEVELKSGTRECTAAFARLLSQTYGLVPERKSKFSRAFALRRGE